MRPDMHPIEPEELMAYLDGELSEARASETARHLAHCRDCQAVAAEMQSVSRTLLAWEIEEAGPGVERAVNAAPLPAPPRPLWKSRMPWIFAMAAAVIGAMVLVRIQGTHPVSRAELLTEPVEVKQAAPEQNEAGPPANEPREPQVARTAQITLTASDFPAARAALDEILKRRGGHIGSLTLGSPPDAGRTLDAVLRVPAAQLDAALADVRRLGRVETEQQTGEEVTRQVVDLDARLANSRNTEQRLADILRHTAGKISDVLEVEKEIGRVRGEIEQMEAERKSLADRISFATLNVRLNEEYKAHLATSTPYGLSRLRNSAVEGYRNAAGSLTGAAAFLLSAGPSLVLWAAILFFPARYLWRKIR